MADASWGLCLADLKHKVATRTRDQTVPRVNSDVLYLLYAQAWDGVDFRIIEPVQEMLTEQGMEELYG